MIKFAFSPFPFVTSKGWLSGHLNGCDSLCSVHVGRRDNFLQRRMDIQLTMTLALPRWLMMIYTTTRLGVSFFLYARWDCCSTIPISRDIHFRGPLLFRWKNDICCAHQWLVKFQNGGHDTRWAVLRRHRTWWKWLWSGALDASFQERWGNNHDHSMRFFNDALS